uniref:Odorant receptor n=1 Tax=Conopomorpha sinensis TaxID=940481 RepID=A0A3S7SGT7_9NEOP|nr:putative odorant receptor 24 [Conopomorpha sinensis]
MLRFLGLGWWHHPDEGDTRNFPGWYLPYSILTQVVWVAGFVGLETIDPFIGSKEDVDRFMFSLSFVITHDLTLIKLYLFFFRNKEIQDIARTIEIEVYDYYQNKDKIISTIRITKIMTSSFVFFGWMAIACSNLNGAFQDFKWRAAVKQLTENETRPERTLAQPIYIPWNFQGEGSYVATFILEAAGLLWTGHIVMFIDTFIGSVILHMSNQFSILQEAFETFIDRVAEELMNGNPQKALLQGVSIDDVIIVLKSHYHEKDIEDALESKMLSCIKQHQLLIRCVEKFSRTYSYGFLTQLLSSMAAICVVMVQVSNDASSFKSISLATSLAFFFAMIIQLAIQCITGNELTLQARGVADAVGRSSWHVLPPRLRRALALVVLRAQRPLTLSAAGFANMNIACFLSIVKAAYSYYAVLSQQKQT